MPISENCWLIEAWIDKNLPAHKNTAAAIRILLLAISIHRYVRACPGDFGYVRGRVTWNQAEACTRPYTSTHQTLHIWGENKCTGYMHELKLNIRGGGGNLNESTKNRHIFMFSAMLAWRGDWAFWEGGGGG